MSTGVLEGRVGIFTVIPMKKTWLSAGHDGEVIFSKAVKGLGPQKSYSGRKWVTGLTSEDEKALEAEMGLKAGTLSPYNKEYWGNYHIPVPKEGIVLDISQPEDYIRYKILKASTQVVSSREDLESEKGLFAECVMTSAKEEAAADSAKIQTKEEAFKKFSQMTVGEMRDFLMVHPDKDGKRIRVTDRHNPDFIKSSVGLIVDTMPKSFLDTLNDKYYKGKLLVEKAIALKLMSKSGNKYFIFGEIDPIGYNIVETIEYLYNPANQSVLTSLYSKLDANE